jgi:ribosomal protein S18 acetylase RimI-like enzyme
MIPINSIEAIQTLIKMVRDRKKGYLTNLFLDIKKFDLWISLGLLEFEEIGESVFSCRKNKGFDNLYFVTTSLEALKNDLERFLSTHRNELFVTDIVGRTNDVSALEDIFVFRGFYKYTSLVRMSRIINEPAADGPNKAHLFFADKEKGADVHALLQYHFDAYAEQLPLLLEINVWAESNRIIIYSDDAKTLQGFLIFELTGQTSYLRYWFVHPDHREKKIGSMLLKKYFADSRSAKRQLFWVIESNINAIKRYEHFGFKREMLFDEIMINKDISYEG